LFLGFEPGAERGDAIFDEVETGPLHDIIFGVIGRGDDFLGHTESGADFCAEEFSIFEELKIGGGKLRADDFCGVPEEERPIGGAGAAFAAAEGGQELLALGVVELIGGADDQAVIGVVLHEAAHERGSGKIGPGGECGCMERWEAAPEVERVGKFFEPNFIWKEDLGLDGRAVAAVGIAPGGEFSVLKDGIKMRRVEHEHAF